MSKSVRLEEQSGLETRAPGFPSVMIDDQPLDWDTGDWISSSFARDQNSLEIVWGNGYVLLLAERIAAATRPVDPSSSRRMSRVGPREPVSSLTEKLAAPVIVRHGAD